MADAILSVKHEGEDVPSFESFPYEVEVPEGVAVGECFHSSVCFIYLLIGN